MSFERIIGLDVINDEQYQQYRKNMMPILHSFGGSFGYDFKIAEVLKSKTDDSINRVFTIEFPDKQTMERFFNDSAYLAVKKQYFQDSVKSVTTIAMHEKISDQ
ncbi:DUF1330 domain-containing protein [Agarivorans sp. MS3-6]|uniref:DUF1330 domain-containing protein n=1 Tax=Agarivorans sp. TSD2052 TaxID=2937286 RepID=UPI00200D7F9D|nr:DUF1330 domain-containing protein [Agarivorans sp. TSD2052]UPW17229.1 DUF1330 domain-containing protein [Agarivorans sp. TSD2052]